MGGFQHFIDAFGLDKHHKTTKTDIARGYRKHPTIAGRLPWMEYDPETKTFLLNDRKSLAIMFDCGDVPSDSKPEEYLERMRDQFQMLIQESIPQEDESPWILQIYFQDDLTLASYVKTIEDYIKPRARGTKVSETVLQLFRDHYSHMTRKGGLFTDTAVSGNKFQGKERKIRMVLYRRLTGNAKLPRNRTAVQAIHQIGKRVGNQLKDSGINVRVCTGIEFYAWMMRWFNPNPKLTGGDVDKLIETCNYPSNEDMPYGYDFTENLFCSVPESDQEKGNWYFDGQPHKMLSIEAMTKNPTVGHLSAERKQQQRSYALFDTFPEGSIFAMTVVIQNQREVKSRIKVIDDSAVGDSAEAVATRKEVEAAYKAIEDKNYLFPVFMSVYITGKDENELYENEGEVETRLMNSGFKVIKGEFDIYPLDSYLRGLPMCYDYEFDRDHLKRSNLMYASHIASLFPFYGRSKGSGNPCIIFSNRAGEPFFFDPFSKLDKSFNSHLMLFGTSGSGKSATLVQLLMTVVMVYNARLIIADAGNSLQMLMQWFKDQGLSTHDVELTKKNPTPLNPFADAIKMLDEMDAMDDLDRAMIVEGVLDLETHSSEEADDTDKQAEEDEERDLIGEMTLALQLMITEGKVAAMEEIDRSDKMVFVDSIISAARTVKAAGRDQVIAEDVANAMEEIGSGMKHEQKQLRIEKHVDAIRYYCKDPFSRRFFNSPGKAWPTVDVTRMEMGIMKNEGYEAQMGLAYMGLMNKALAQAEATQYDDRITIIVTDESHVVTANPSTSGTCTKISKMARKLNLWQWFATQNLDDFPDSARKMLTMMEHWILLGTSEDEIAKVEQFKTLTEEEKELFRSVKKENGKYTEGILLSSKYKGLFRNVPPRLSLSLGMSEGEEKAERKQIMDEHSVSEVAAAEIKAQRMTDSLLETEDANDFF